MSEPAKSAASPPVAVVTGGYRGIGRAIIETLAGEGYVGACIDLPSADVVQSEHPLPSGFRHYQLDISDVERHQATVSAIIDDFGQIDTLVNNAGVPVRPLTDILDVQPHDFDFSLGVNLRGTFFLTQAVVRRMLETPSARYRSIVNVSSIAAQIASYERAQYAIGKAAVSTITKLFAARLAPESIYVHEVRPGFIRTDMTAGAASGIDARIEQGLVPLRRWGTPEDVARTVTSLATGLLPYTTGESVWVAGGINIPQVR